MHKDVKVAITSPCPFNIGGEQYNAITMKMIDGSLTDPDQIRGHIRRFLDHQLVLVDSAAENGAEVVLLTEDCLRLGGFIQKQGNDTACRALVDEALAQWLACIGDLCRKYRISVIGGTLTHQAGAYYNSAILVGPNGKPGGAYHKTHLPEGEAKFLAQGDELPVFDTHFGRIGILICWDIIFPETFAELALKGAEIVFQPTFGHQGEDADITARARALDWSIPLAVSMWKGGSIIVDAHGRIIARVSEGNDPIGIASVSLDTHRQFGCMKDARREKPLLRRPELYRLQGTVATPSPVA